MSNDKTKILLLVFIFNICFVCNTTLYEKVYYVSYSPPSLTNADYHNIVLVKSKSGITQQTPEGTSKTWFYSVVRDSDGNSDPINNNDDNLNRYQKYLLSWGSSHEKAYVAFQITATCSSNQVRINMRIRYFTSNIAAERFYNLITPTNKVLYKQDGTFTSEGTLSFGTATSLDVKNVIGNNHDASYGYCI